MFEKQEQKGKLTSSQDYKIPMGFTPRDSHILPVKFYTYGNQHCLRVRTWWVQTRSEFLLPPCCQLLAASPSGYQWFSGALTEEHQCKQTHPTEIQTPAKLRQLVSPSSLQVSSFSPSSPSALHCIIFDASTNSAAISVKTLRNWAALDFVSVSYVSHHQSRHGTNNVFLIQNSTYPTSFLITWEHQ